MAPPNNNPSQEHPTTEDATKSSFSVVLVPVPSGMPIPGPVEVPLPSSPRRAEDTILGVTSEQTLINLCGHHTEDEAEKTPNWNPEKAEGDKKLDLYSHDNGMAEVVDVGDVVEDDDAIMTFPDGGFGWWVVFGAFMIQFCCWGFNFCWGVYQQFYIENNIFDGATLAQVSWSGGIGTASVFLTTPFQSSMVARFGLRPVIVMGIFISGSGIILGSFAKTLWQLYLTQGFMYGLGAGMALFTSVAIPVQWFDKKRGLASGITVAGSGLGGATLAPLNRYLISTLGYQWALRIMGISSVTIVCSVLFCIQTRIPPRKRGGPLFDVGMFKNSGFTLMYLMGMLVTFGYLTPIFLLPKFVTDLGMDPSVGATLVGIFSGVNAVSRVMTGFVADWYGSLNILILTTAFSGLACYIFWMNTRGLAMAIVFVIVYGANAGGFNSLFPVVAADVIGLETLAASVGLLYSGNFFGNLLGTPLASAIVAASGGRYTWTIVFAGTAPILGAILLLFIRFKHEKRIFVKM